MSKKQKRKSPSAGKRSQDITSLFETAYGLHVKGDDVRAEELYLRIIRQDPRNSNALNLLGTIYLERGEHDKALVLIKKAIQAYPMGAMFHNNLGNVFREMGLSKDAEKAYREALRVDPDCVSASNNLGTMLHEQGDMDGAVVCFEKACRKDPGFSPAYYNLGRVFCEQGRIVTAMWAYKEALKINPDFQDAHSNYLYSLHFSDTVTPEQIFDEHAAWASSFAEKHYPDNPVFDNDRDRFRRLRIGYVSPDFRTHSVAYFLEDVMAAHNKDKFEIFCYSCSDKKDDFTQRFRELSDNWRDVSLLSDDDACRMIREDRIDILVDLAGHTRNSRILIFARKPAPIQVAWLGYPDTTGLKTMDYRITDALADPPGESDRLSSEKLIRLAGGFHCYRPSGESYPISAPPFMKTGAVTFGSFNNNSKISERVIAVWARILKQAEGSRLKLKSRSFSDFGTRKFILERFAHHGVPSERIWFEGYKVSLKEHFLLYNTVDIALDTFPYNGTTTTCEALWMGVPVIALEGNNHASRVGASLLRHAGLDSCVAATADDYVEKAVALARNAEHLQGYRSTLRERMSRSSLMNPVAFTEKLEYAFRGMWVEWVERQTGSNQVVDECIRKDVLENNIAALKRFHPGIETLLSGIELQETSVSFSPQGIPVLRFKKGNDGEIVMRTQGITKEFHAIQNRLKDVRGKVVCVMGDGMFVHARAILEIAGARNLVVFFEAHPEILKASLESLDITDIVAHPHARFAVGPISDPYDLIGSDDDGLYTNHGRELIEFGQFTALAPEWYASRREVFEQYLSRRRLSLKTAMAAGRRFLGNSFENLMGLAESHPLKTLNDTMKGIPAIVVASGPSLSKNIGELERAGGKAWIIAVDSALAPLMERGITPHAVVSVDYNEFTYEKLAPFVENLGGTDLVYIPAVTSKILNGIRFRNRYFSFPDKGLRDLFNRLLKTDGDALEDVHSVVHLAISAALTAGCDPIIFTGLDLAFAGKSDHAAGTILHWNGEQAKAMGNVMVMGVDGTMVESTHGFVAAKEICERMIATAGGRTFIDATEGGAKIKGTEILSLAETLSVHCFRTCDMRGNLPCRDVPGLKVVLSQLESIEKDLGGLMDQITLYEKELNVVDSYMKSIGERMPDPSSLPRAVGKSAGTMDRISRALDQSPLMSSLTCVFTEYYDEYLKAEMDVAAESLSPGRRFAAALKQQAFVQEIRKKAVTLLSELSGAAHGFIRLTETILSDDGLSWGQTGDTRLTGCLDMLIDHRYLVKAGELLSKTGDHPLKEFYEGCLRVTAGAVEDGTACFQSAFSKDEGLGHLIETFKMKTIGMLLNEEGPNSYRKICIDRALKLDRQNEKAVAAARDRLASRVMVLLDSGDYPSAFDEMDEANRLNPIEDEVMQGIFAILLLHRGERGRGLGFLRKSIEKQWVCSGRDFFLKRHFFLVIGETRFLPEGTWVKDLVDFARKEAWAKRAVQELFRLNIGFLPGKILQRRISEQELTETETMLNAWGIIERVVPEWLNLKAWTRLGRGDLEGAQRMIFLAGEVEKETVARIGEKGIIAHDSAMIALYRNDISLGLEILQGLLETTEGVFCNFRLTACLLYFRTGNMERARELLNGIFVEESDYPWIGRVLEAFRNGTMIQDMEEYRPLHFLSWYYYFTGKIFVESGDKLFGSSCLLASVNHDPSILIKKDKAWLSDFVLERWHEDCSMIELFLDGGEFEKAESLCLEWESTRAVLRDYHPVRAVIREKMAGLEGALAYLESLPQEEADDSHILFYLAKILFSLDKRDQALRVLSRAVELDSGAAELWEEIGDVLFGEGDHRQAISAYEMCVSSLPSRTDVIRKIGDVYLAMGMQESAVMAYKAVIRADRTNELAMRRIREIEGRG